MKSYTDLGQSKKLTEILPLESADFHFSANQSPQGYLEKPIWGNSEYADYNAFPCWSLAALLSVLPKEIEIDGQHYAPCLFPVKSKWLLKLWYNSNYTFTSPISIFSDNPVDACVEMIVKLKSMNLL